jgi:hypothetical protein
MCSSPHKCETFEDLMLSLFFFYMIGQVVDCLYYVFIIAQISICICTMAEAKIYFGEADIYTPPLFFMKYQCFCNLNLKLLIFAMLVSHVSVPFNFTLTVRPRLVCGLSSPLEKD